MKRRARRKETRRDRIKDAVAVALYLVNSTCGTQMNTDHAPEPRAGSNVIAHEQLVTQAIRR